MANDDFESFLRRASNYNGGAPEYFEDTHDNFGNYTGSHGVASQYGGQYNHSVPPPQYAQPQTFSQPVPPAQPQFQQPLYTSGPQSPYAQPHAAPNPAANTERSINNPPNIQYYDVPAPERKAAPLPKMDQYISPRLYQNIVLYSPRTATDVERLIDYLRRREPAIVDLDPISESPDAQRVLDFTSGAVYALGGRIINIKTNTYLIVPEGVEVAKPETDGK